MRIAISGASGFIGTNLSVRLCELANCEAIPIGRTLQRDALVSTLSGADALVHLAGVNRPEDEAEFAAGNRDFTQALVDAVEQTGRLLPIIYASSTKATDTTSYGISKKAAEDILFTYCKAKGNPLAIYRLPNVFGKWSRPNYNSAVATFCHNISRGLDINVVDPAAKLQLVYIDDLVDSFLKVLQAPSPPHFESASPVYDTTVGEVATLIQAFQRDRQSSTVDHVGVGLARALYSTFISFLPISEFSKPLVVHADPRGRFAEILRTRSSGQFSFFTALPGVTRGGHYHHTKTEKFLIVQGTARFCFRHMVTGEVTEIETSADKPTVVETIPGWAHDITNVGSELLISLLWANELFDRDRPDTIAAAV